MDEGLVIVPAGAGAGKTHHIQVTLSDWVQRGIVRPDRILAVTYTEAAATELRERIRSGLLKDGLVTEALAVERAYVSTIHGLGLRLLTEHALTVGASPQPRHLGDAERDLLIRQALAQSSALDPVKADPGRFGYAPDFGNDTSAEEAIRARVLAMIDLLRGLGDAGRDPGLIAPAIARLDEVHGPVVADPDAARTALLDAICAMLGAFPEGGMASVTAAGPKETLERNLALFRRIARDPGLLDRDWAGWQALRKLFVSNSRSRTPEGYDDHAQAIMAAADLLPSHPGPLADAKLHLTCLISCAQEVMAAYEARKKAFGLIDYADMIAGAELLLRTNPSVRKAVMDEIDCVIIDEFQDTSPVQFALLWQLGQNAPRTLLVGDVKQSIMGFQGADPRLSMALAAANPQAIRPLDRNWRSTPAVMDFVNAVGAGLFGAGYNRLEPTRRPIDGPALEVLNITKGRGTRTGSKPQEHVAERIATLLSAAEIITDRKTGAPRPVRPSDVALLVCRHSTAAKYAEELRQRGVPVRIVEDGWLDCPVVLAALAALAFLANPTDIHAALILRTLGPEPLDLEQALSMQIEDSLLDDPLLLRLAGLADAAEGLPVSVAVQQAIAATGLLAWADRHENCAQARADLLRLEAEAEEFEVAHRDLKAASGFFGETAKVFLGWLDARRSERDFDRRPAPSANHAEAVEITTWHASKGREWPITVVAEFDYGIEERPGTTSACFDALDRISDMAAVLASSRLIHTPVFAAPEVQARFIEDRRTDFEATARNLLYVALTRARDRLILEWPGFLKARPADVPGASCLFHVFEDACRPALTGNALSIGGTSCPATVRNMPDQANLTALSGAQGGTLRLFGKAAPLACPPLTPWRLQPSQAEAVGPPPRSSAITIGSPLPPLMNDATRGTALHLALRTCLVRPDLASSLPDATGLSPDELALVAERARALRNWLEQQGYPDLRPEIALLGRSPEGAEIPGMIDLLASGPRGSLLIDHKSGGTGQGLGPYWPQLAAYVHLISQALPGHNLRGAAIFWIDHGSLELVTLPVDRAVVSA